MDRKADENASKIVFSRTQHHDGMVTMFAHKCTRLEGDLFSGLAASVEKHERENPIRLEKSRRHANKQLNW